jgi:Family of unknown function (DUF6067)
VNVPLLAVLLVGILSRYAGPMAPPPLVPAPWTPLTIQGEVVRCWGRDYRIQGGMPRQIISQGERLLTGPVHLKVDDGLPFNWTQRLRSRQERAVQWRASAVPRGLTLRTCASLEYDGFLQVDLALGRGTLHRVSLEIPLVSRYARYLHFVNETHYQHQNTFALAEHDGVSWSNPFACMVWLGDERVGLAWCADSDAPFRLRSPERAIVVRRTGATTTLRITLIDHRVTLTEPLRWRFGLIATPVRPMPPRWREWRLGPGTFANMHILWWNAWARTHADPVPKDGTALAQRARQARTSRQYLLPYVALLALSERSRAYRNGGERWRREPVSRLEDEGTPYWIICPNTTWERYLPDRMVHLFRDTGINGVYFDFTFPYRCSAVEHPCGYTTPGGERRGEFRVFATRRLLQAIYERVKAIRPDSRILLHTSGALMYPYIGFGDLMLNGEQLRQPLTASGGAYMEVLPLAVLRAEYQGHHAGLAPFVIPELATRAGLPDPKLTAEAAPTNELLALTLLHDLGVWPIYCDLAAVNAVREAQRRFGTAEASFAPYWESGGPAIMGDRALLASAWVRSGAMLLVVVNRSRQEAQTHLRLRAEVCHDPLIRAQDALAGKELPVDAASLRLSVPARGFRLLRLSTRPAHGRGLRSDAPGRPEPSRARFGPMARARRPHAAKLTRRQASPRTAERVLLDAHLVYVPACLVALRAAEDQLLQRRVWHPNEMEVLILPSGTGRDHGLRPSGNISHDRRRVDAGHVEADRKRVTVWRLRGRHPLACHSHDREHHAGCDGFTVREQLEQPADADRRNHRGARAGSEELPPADPALPRVAAEVFLLKFGQKPFRATEFGPHSHLPFIARPERSGAAAGGSGSGRKRRTAATA